MNIYDVVQGVAAGVGIDLSPDGKLAYYVEWSVGQLSRVDTSNGAVTTIKSGLSLPQDVEVDWTTGEIFISERTGAIVRLGGRRKPARIADPGGAPHQMALVKDGTARLLYVVCYDSGKLRCIDLATQQVTDIASGLAQPIGLVVDAKHRYAYVTEQGTGSLSRIKIANGQKASLFTGLVSPFFLAWDSAAKAIYCVQRDPANSLVRLKLASPMTSTLVANGLAWRPSGVAPGAGNKHIYITADQKVQVLAAAGAGPTIHPGNAPFDIHSIEFIRGRTEAFVLKRHETGNLIAKPEYLRGSRNEPAAYPMRTLPRLRVVLRQRSGYAGGSYAIGATGSLGGVRRKDVAPVFQASGLSNAIDFEFMWPLPGWVCKPDATLGWYARKLPGPSVPAGIDATVHRLYVVAGLPTEPWVATTPWVAALELACGWADGAWSADEAATRITRRYNASGRVSYDTNSGATFYYFNNGAGFMLSQMIDRMNGGFGLGEKVNCTDSANTVSTLANVLGCDLWQSRMQSGFRLNPMIAIGYGTWAIPFSGSFSYHEVAWKGACTSAEQVFDGCLHVDADADPTAAPHIPLLATNMVFGDCTTMTYRLRLCPPGSNGCGACQPAPATRKRRLVG